MLQDNKTRAIIDDLREVIPQEEGLAEVVQWVLGFLSRQYLVISFIAALGFGLGIIYLALATPNYTGQTSVYIDLHKNALDSQAGIFGNDPIEIESQIQLIKSKAVALSVIKK